MKLQKLNRTVIYLALTDFVWYLASAFLFFSSFYTPITEVLRQAQDAIAENTQSLAQTQDPLTSQISLAPHAQLLITYILFFVALMAVLGIFAEFIKIKLMYKKPFWWKTTYYQVLQLFLFLAAAAVSQYLLYIQLAVPIIPMWFMLVILTVVWGLFFWFCAQVKSRLYAKKKAVEYGPTMAIVLVGVFILLLSFQILELAIIAGLFWLISWNWLQLHMANAPTKVKK